MVLRHFSSSVSIESTLIAVLSGRDWSRSNFSRITCRPSGTGTLVKSDFTSKLTMMVSSLRVRLLIFRAKSAEFLTKEVVWPAKGAITLARCLANAYVGEPIVLTIGRSGTSSLCILGKP